MHPFNTLRSSRQVHTHMSNPVTMPRHTVLDNLMKPCLVEFSLILLFIRFWCASAYLIATESCSDFQNRKPALIASPWSSCFFFFNHCDVTTVSCCFTLITILFTSASLWDYMTSHHWANFITSQNCIILVINDACDKINSTTVKVFQ